MKIIELNIYGYGQFNHINFTLNPHDFQVIYGKNEAGKSTIMSFIQSILFGFPAKIQNENRYEPKQVKTYGGALIVDTEQYGKVKIERLPGKAAGEVTLYFENGETGSREILDQMLSHFDKSMYKSIFSFDIHGIQQVSKVSADELGKFLLSSGLLGTDALLQTENQLLKKQELLYKPNGKKPEINTALSRLKTLHSDMLKAKEQIQPYAELMKEKEIIERQLMAKAESKSMLEAKSRRLAEIIDALPLWIEEESILAELTKTIQSFPADGLKRMDEIEAKEEPLLSEKRSLVRSLEDHQQAINQLSDNESILSHQAEIEHLRETNSAYHAKKDQHQQYNLKYGALSRKISEEKERLFAGDLDDESLLSINTSITAKEEIREIVSDYQQLQQRKQLLDQQFERAKENLEESENRLTDYAKGLLGAEERKLLEEKVKQQEAMQQQVLDEKRAEDEYRSNEKKINEQSKTNQSKKNQMNIMKAAAAVLLILCSGWMIYEQQWLILPFLLGLIGLVFFFLFQNDNGEDAFLIHLRDKQEELKRQLEQSRGQGYTDTEELRGILWKDEQLRRSHELEQVTFAQNERAYHRTVSGFDEWEKDLYQLNTKVKKAYSDFRMSSEFSPLALPDLLQTLLQLQKDIRECSQIETKLAELTSALSAYVKQMESVCEKCGFDQKTDLNEGMRNLSAALQDSMEKKSRQLMFLEKISDAEHRLAKIEADLSLLSEKKKELFHLSNSADAEDFRKKAEEAENRRSLEQKLKWIQQQLQAKKHLLKDGKLDFLIDYKEEKLLCDKELKAQIEQESSLQRRLSELAAALKNIEESGLYSELKQKYELEKGAVKQLAHKWAVLAAAKNMLNKTVEFNRSVRLPKVLEGAEHFFSIMTNYQYRKIFLPDSEQTLLVEKADGNRFAANELSQATAEQLYISLRLSLARHLSTEQGLPIIIDDGFVNFDFDRTKQVLSLLEEFSKQHQIIFFTCQEHLLPLFKEEQILDLKAKEQAAKQVSIGQRLL